MSVVRELVNLIKYTVDSKSFKDAESKNKKFIDSIKGIGLAVGAGFLALGGIAIKTAGDMESINAQFAVMLGNEEKASKLIADLTEFAKVTPFQLSDLSEGAKMLLQYGVSADRILPSLQMLGDVAGDSSERFKALSYAFGQIRAANKANMQDIRQMINAGFNPLNVIAQKTGETYSDLESRVSDGAVSFEEISDAFKTVTSEGGTFFKNMIKQSETLNGLMSTLKDAFVLELAEGANKVLPDIKNLIKRLTEMINTVLGGLVEQVTSVLVPVFNILANLLTPAINILTSILGIIITIAKFIASILNQSVMPLIDSLINMLLPVLEDINNALKPLLNTLTPLLNLMVRSMGIFLKLSLFRLLLPLRFILKLLISILKIIEAVLTPILNFFDFIMKKIDEFVNWIINKIFGIADIIAKFFTDIFFKIFEDIKTVFFIVVNGIIDMINNVFGLMNKLPFVKDKFKLLKNIENENRPEKISYPTGTTTTNNVNVNPQIQFNNSNIQDTQDVKKALQQSASTVFQLELKKVLLSTT